MRRHERWGARIALSFCVAALAAAPREANAHPLHTTLVQLTFDERAHALVGSIRVLAGDFAAAVAKHAGARTPDDDRVTDAAAFAYVSSTFRFTDAAGHPIALEWCGSRRVNDLLWLCVRGATTSSPRALQLTDQMLCELFDDQINIVQAVSGDKHASALFTRGDGAKSAM
ncbi:MAG TPA: DUF6702 family protein [Gemmatimonadaceae bacterium]